MPLALCYAVGGDPVNLMEIKYKYSSYPQQGQVCLRIIRECLINEEVCSEQVIAEICLPTDREQSGVFDQEKIAAQIVRPDLSSKDCHHTIVARLDESAAETCCECGQPANFLVKSKSSTLLSGYCTKHLPTPLWDSQAKQVIAKIGD